MYTYYSSLQLVSTHMPTLNTPPTTFNFLYPRSKLRQFKAGHAWFLTYFDRGGGVGHVLQAEVAAVVEVFFTELLDE